MSFYVRPGSAVDKEARKRGNSVYFPDRVVPMLPEVLSADVCSLKAGAPRAAMACHMNFDAEGKMTAFRFTRAIVRIAEVIAYEEAQARIDEGRAEKHLTDLWEAWKVLEAARNKRDPLNLELPERRVQLDEKGRIAGIALRERLDAHRVVEDFMIAANVAAAKALESKVAPVVYRIHEPPNREKLVALKDYLATFERKLALGQVITPALFNRMLKSIEDEAEKALIMEAVLRSQTQAYYGPKNAGHFGLALGSYAHFTSPIRRYSDLLVHRSLVDAFGLEQPAPQGDIPEHSGLAPRDRQDMARITDAISRTERRAMEAERETIDRYVAAWLSTRVGEIFQCRITGVQRFGLFATIVGLGGDGLVPVSVLGDERFFHDEKAQVLRGEQSGITYAIGDRLPLRLAEANPLTGALKFEPEDSDGRIEKRGAPAPVGLKKRGSHLVGQRGRPANIRHQGNAADDAGESSGNSARPNARHRPAPARSPIGRILWVAGRGSGLAARKMRFAHFAKRLSAQTVDLILGKAAGDDHQRAGQTAQTRTGEVSHQRARLAIARGAQHQRGNLGMRGEVIAHDLHRLALLDRDLGHASALGHDGAGQACQQHFRTIPRFLLDGGRNAAESDEGLGFDHAEQMHRAPGFGGTPARETQGHAGLFGFVDDDEIDPHGPSFPGSRTAHFAPSPIRHKPISRKPPCRGSYFWPEARVNNISPWIED
jgi:hypothetical protein